MTKLEYCFSCFPSFRILDAKVAESFIKNKYPESNLDVKEKEAGTHIVQAKSDNCEQVTVTIKEIPESEILNEKDIIRRAQAQAQTYR